MKLSWSAGSQTMTFHTQLRQTARISRASSSQIGSRKSSAHWPPLATQLVTATAVSRDGSSIGSYTTHSRQIIRANKFFSWTESSLKSFLDHNKIPNPQPRTRDSMLTLARQNYDAIAKKTSSYAAYPGDWLYSSWSESDLKEFLDARGLPSPQPTTRDKLIASVRRNARLASLNMSSAASSASKSASSASSIASASAASAQAGLSDALFNAWSDSKLKEYLDEQGVPVPQGSKKNELIALARKQRASVAAKGSSTASSASASGASLAGKGTSVATSVASVASASGASAFGAATSRAGNAYAQATDDASAKIEDLFQSAVDTWSDSRLKAFLDARGVPVPQSGKRDELIASVRLNKHKASTGWSAWTFDTWTVENLQDYLAANTKKYKKKANANRDDLIKSAQSAYATASSSGGTNYASVTSYLAKQTDSAKDSTFDTWSDSQLKSYLDSYGVPNYQGSNTNELRAMAKKQYNYFKYGTSTPSGTIFERIKAGFGWGLAQLQGGASSGSATASASASSAASVASNSATSASGSLGSSASSAASIISKHASSAKKEL